MATKKSKKKVIILSIATVVLIAAVLLVILGSKRETVTSVQTEKAELRTITQTVTATGKISPEVQVVISPEVSGEIIELPVKEGMNVKKGDLLMKIKPDIYIAMRDHASAGVVSSRASLEKANADYKRAQELFGKGLISSSDLEAAKTNYDVMRAQNDQATASLSQAAEDLRKTTINAPMDGTVSSLKVEKGERVLGTSQFQGTEVMTIADLSRMEARVNVSENDVVLLKLNDTTRIAVDAYPDKKLVGLVYEIANTGSTTGSGTQEEVTNFLVKIRVVTGAEILRPGMSMTATIETETKRNVIAVPIQSVTTRSAEKGKMGQGQGQAPAGQDAQSDQMAQSDTRIKQKIEKPREVVFVVENGMAKTVEVKRGIADDSYVEISSGMTQGKEVVSGSYKAINRDLEDGAKVKVENGPKAKGPSVASK